MVLIGDYAQYFNPNATSDHTEVRVNPNRRSITFHGGDIASEYSPMEIAGWHP